MGAWRAAWARAAIKTKALRMILAGRLGKTPAMTMLLSANNRIVFIILPPITVSLGLEFYCSTRNFDLFFRLLLTRRPPSIRATSKTNARRMIFAGRLGSTPAVITVLTANKRNIFMV